MVSDINIRTKTTAVAIKLWAALLALLQAAC
jgi:hypothetical protein